MDGQEVKESVEEEGIEADKIEKNIEDRKEKIKKWLKDRYNLAFVGVIIFAFILRWYYFVLTKNQPLWWDEAAYGTLAKNFVYHLWDKSDIVIGETLIRPPLFPLIWSVLIKIGFNEVVNRFLLEFLPSVISVAFVYFIGKELYNKKIGLIASFIFSSLWIHLFYTGRLLTHSLSIAFLFDSIYFFIKESEYKINYKYFAISIILSGFVT